MNAKRLCAVALAGLLGGQMFSGQESPTDRVPVLVELFTSEGCSSCPPADAVLERLDRSQPVAGALAVVLSEHVDYWNRLGWRDPFSAAVHSRRQEGYARRFRLDSVYTPQIVVDGTTETVGNDEARVRRLIREAAERRKGEIRISEVRQDSPSGAYVQIEIPAATEQGRTSGAHLWMALADSAAETAVLRGENQGRKLKHVAVLREMADLGGIDTAQSSQRRVELTGRLAHWQGRRLVAFVQEGGQGRVLALGMRMLNVSRL